jgi:hypothetical protein
MDIASLATKVVTEAANKALLAHGVPGGGAVTQTLLGELMQVQEQQVQTLQRIERSVDRLVDEPWNTARMYLKEAQQARDPSSWTRN